MLKGSLSCAQLDLLFISPMIITAQLISPLQHRILFVGFLCLAFPPFIWISPSPEVVCFHPELSHWDLLLVTFNNDYNSCPIDMAFNIFLGYVMVAF